ncbi:MAG TPA: hypothetical protein VKD71_03835 [Gemmataceae bacterium]|nr:hypothetical protein [Gemmataceae bacterium]
MLPLFFAVVSWAGDRADDVVIGYYLKAAASESKAVKHEAMVWGLAAIDRKQYSRQRADTIAQLYGNVLVQNVSSLTKRRICKSLAKMDDLDASVDVLLQLADSFKAEAAARPQPKRPEFTTGTSWLEKDGDVADDLIAALWTKKSGGRSHFSGGVGTFARERRELCDGFQVTGSYGSMMPSFAK